MVSYRLGRPRFLLGIGACCDVCCRVEDTAAQGCSCAELNQPTELSEDAARMTGSSSMESAGSAIASAQAALLAACMEAADASCRAVCADGLLESQCWLGKALNGKHQMQQRRIRLAAATAETHGGCIKSFMQ